MSFGGRPFGKATCNWKGERSGEEDREGCAVGGRERNPYEKGKKKKKGIKEKVKGNKNHWPVCIHTSSDLLLCCVRGGGRGRIVREKLKPRPALRPNRLEVVGK